MTHGLSASKILVTGGTGFIGGRLVEKLTLTSRIPVRVLVHDFARAWKLARLPVEMVQGDVAEPQQVRNAAQGCDVIVHCAYGTAGEQETKRQATIEGTRNVLEAALQLRLKRVVHLSTLMVYGVPPDGDLDETAPRHYLDNLYADSKLDAENLALDYAKTRGVPVVVLQPGIVYGPYARFWTMNIVDSLKAGKVILVNGGQGLCNAVYIDDLVQAILLSIKENEAAGETFLISAAEPVTWRTFFEHYEQILGFSSTVSMSAAEAIDYYRQQAQPRRSILRESIEIIRENPLILDRIVTTREVAGFMKAAGFLVPKPVRESLKGKILTNGKNGSESIATKPEKPLLPLDPLTVRMYAAKTRVRIDKARRLLGYRPAFDLSSGMNVTEQWLRWAKLVH